MEQVPGMLWLAAGMGLLAACAFSFLFYLVLRRPRTADAFEDEPTLAAAFAEDTECPEAEAADELADAHAVLQSVDTTPDGAPVLATDQTVPDAAEEGMEVANLCPSALDARHDTEADDTDADDTEAEDTDAEDAAAMSAALALVNAVAPEPPLQPSASPETEGDWFATADGTPEFDDFDPRHDDLVLVWDDASGPEPSVLVRRSEDDPAVTHVLMGDVILAQVRTRSDVDHCPVSLMPLSLARTLGWAHA